MKSILDEINEQGVSIIIGARNEYPQIAMTVGNLMEDMHHSGITRYEVIIMDNGSDDETSRFFAWKPEDKTGRWRYIYSPRGMVSEGRLRIFFDPVCSNVGTRNKGTEKARYKNVIFSDAHIIVRPGTVKSIVETLIKFGGIVHAPISWLGASSDNPDPGYQYSYKVGEKIWGCVDEKTELLTSGGWKSWNEVDKNTYFATINRETKDIEYQQPTELTIKDFDGMAISIENNDVSMLLTPDHRTLVNDMQIVSAKDVQVSDKIPVFSNGIKHESRFSEFSDPFVAILGWVLTDGGYDYKDGKYPRVRIFQKKLPQSETIRKDLQDSGLDYFEFTDPYGKNIFNLNAETSRMIVKMFPNRVLTQDFIFSLSREQALIMIDRMLLADGHKKVFYKTDKNFVDAYQALCVHAGVSTKFDYKSPEDFHGNRYGKRGIFNVITGSTRQFKSVVKEESYTGKMWCPTLPNGTVVARRNGKVFFTGNTWNKIKVAEEPFFIPVCGHAFMGVRRDEFLEVGGYPLAQRVYGGGEPYLDTKYWMLGKTSMMDPRALVYHLSAGRGYNWHSDDLLHNMLLVSYILGGQKWMDRILITYLNKPGVSKHYLYFLAQTAVEEGEKDRLWLEENRSHTFEEVLGLDHEDEIYKDPEITKDNPDWWCTRCTKRGFVESHVLRPWDKKNDELHGHHRSYVQEFKLTRKDGKVFIGNTEITDHDAVELASKYV